MKIELLYGYCWLGCSHYLIVNGKMEGEIIFNTKDEDSREIFRQRLLSKYGEDFGILDIPFKYDGCM